MHTHQAHEQGYDAQMQTQRDTPTNRNWLIPCLRCRAAREDRRAMKAHVRRKAPEALKQKIRRHISERK